MNKEEQRQLRHKNRQERYKRTAEAKHLRKLERIQNHKDKIAKAKEQKTVKTSPDLFKTCSKEKTLTPCYICHTPTEGKFCSDECVQKYFK